MRAGDVILSHLAELPKATLSNLYDDLWTAVAVLRSLPPLARQIVLRLVYLDGYVDVSQWVSDEGGQLTDSLVLMKKVRVIKLKKKDKDETTARGSMVQLESSFREQLRRSLAERNTSPFTKGREADRDPNTAPDALRNWAQRRWESLLHFMVGPAKQASTRPEPGWKPVRELKQQLLRPGRNGECLMQEMSVTVPEITKAGFHFLLRPLRAQVWQLLMDMVFNEQATGSNAEDILKCVFQLSFCSVGTGYALDNLNSKQQKFVQDLAPYGIVFFRPDAPRKFYPTHLVVNLCSDVDSRSAAAHSKDDDKAEEVSEGRCLIVETNYRVYAYTTSVLQEEVLRLFSQVLYKFPNMLISVITRSSVRNALVKGITAAQIIQYLHVHAHPQINFWEKERCRIVPQPAVIYHDFYSIEAFKLAEAEAYKPTILEGGTTPAPECLYSDAAELVVVVGEEGHEHMKRFIEQNIQG